MKVDTWMPFFIGDYLKDTSRLSTLRHGAYCLLLFDYWIHGAPPDDDETLAAITKLPLAEWQRKHRKALERFFKVRDGHWHHDRVDEELVLAKKRCEASEAKGRAGAEARYGKKPKDASSDAPGSAPSIPDANPEHASSPSPTSPSLRSGEGAPAVDKSRKTTRHDAWYASEVGILGKGAELGLEPRKGELLPAYKYRIEKRLEELAEVGT